MATIDRIEASRFGDLDDLADAEKGIVAFVEEHMVDEHGLLMAHLNVETLKPWTIEQIEAKGLELTFYDKRRGDPVGQLTYEDSLMATGEYAQSRLLKFEATRDPAALAEAAQPVFALLRVLEEGGKYERGFLPKPHGGMTRAAYSHEISVDQYIKTITALRLWQPYCGASLRGRIDDHFVAMADYHLVRGFIHPRREGMIVTPENRTHGMAFFIPILVLAHKITGEAAYRDALSRFDPILDELLSGEVPTNCNLVSLFTEGFDLALNEGHDDARLARLIGKLWQARLRVTEERGPWNDDPNDTYPSSRALRIAAFAPIVDRHAPGADAWKLGVHLLKGMTDPREMRYANVDPDALSPGRRYRACCLCETSISSWLVGYWGLVNEGRQTP